MKRLMLYATATVVLMLVASGAFGAQAAITPLGVTELASITAGICTTCGEPTPPPPPSQSPRLIATEWRIISQNETPHRQLSYSVLTERVNRSATPAAHSPVYSNDCRHVLTSGGIGIAASLNVSIGTTYHCAQTQAVTFTVPPFSRTKLYKGEMRYFTNYEAAVVNFFSNGREEVTSRRDYGVRRHDYSRFNAVTNPL